jgi:L-seryl-tRNA(Ser) seleniumtransferase
MRELLRHLPSVDEVLKDERVKEWLGSHPRALVLDAVRTAIDRKREQVLKSCGTAAPDLSPAAIVAEAGTVLRELSEPSLRPLINATGVVVHTNLGRSLLSEAAIERVIRVNRSYSNLEYDIEAGERGKRHTHIEPLLKRLTGAEAATAVNNNAAAVLLCLNTLARGKEVVGSFRVPEVMERSGAALREVGSTNKTHLKDYEKAITPNTGLLLKVHTSNYKIVGFTKEVSPAELAALGRKHKVPVMWDLGSGSFLDLASYGIGDEPTVKQAMDAGVDVLTFSGDKLLGGPQAGMILGRKQYLDPIRANPLARALRIDKMTLAALEATLAQYLDEEKAVREIPTLWMLTQPLAEIKRKAELLSAGLASLGGGLTVGQQDDLSQTGGGALPTGKLPTRVVAVSHVRMSASRIESRLRLGKPAIVTRIKEGMVLFDPRTLNDGEIDKIVTAVKAILPTTDEHR